MEAELWLSHCFGRASSEAPLRQRRITDFVRGLTERLTVNRLTSQDPCQCQCWSTWAGSSRHYDTDSKVWGVLQINKMKITVKIFEL